MSTYLLTQGKFRRHGPTTVMDRSSCIRRKLFEDRTKKIILLLESVCNKKGNSVRESNVRETVL